MSEKIVGIDVVIEHRSDGKALATANFVDCTGKIVALEPGQVASFSWTANHPAIQFNLQGRMVELAACLAQPAERATYQPQEFLQNSPQPVQSNAVRGWPLVSGILVMATATITDTDGSVVGQFSGIGSPVDIELIIRPAATVAQGTTIKRP